MTNKQIAAIGIGLVAGYLMLSKKTPGPTLSSVSANAFWSNPQTLSPVIYGGYGGTLPTSQNRTYQFGGVW